MNTKHYGRITINTATWYTVMQQYVRALEYETLVSTPASEYTKISELLTGLDPARLFRPQPQYIRKFQSC